MSNQRIVGIDLGTTNSLVAFMQGDVPVVIPGDDGLNLVPSVVALDENDQIIIGNAARKYLIETPERAVYSIKRLMGRGIEDIREELKLFPFRLAEDLQPAEVLRIKLGDKTFTPPEISAFILRQLKRNAERFFAAPVTQAVITVPAYFNDAQRQATKDAGRIAGLEVLRLVNEPTAAALAYGLDRAKEGIVAVYDLGGGTFDVSILKLHEGIFEVISTNGDTLVGGSTRIPAVRALVDTLFGLSARGRKAHTELNPDEVVALGAAVQADILAGGSAATEDLLLLDVTPLSLGIEALGGVVAKIIQRNSTIPASATEHFTTGVDGQLNVAIHVVQGERELAKDCRSLARFDLKGIPPMPAGLPRIEVKYLIDANGILHVSAREQRSGKEAEVEVKPTYGLTDEQVEDMIIASFDHAQEDFRKRQVIEAGVEADNILLALEKGRRSPAWQQLTGDEKRRIELLETELEEAKSGDDYKTVRAAIDALNEGTMRLAELMMESAVGSALKGKDMRQLHAEGPAAPHPIA